MPGKYRELIWQYNDRLEAPPRFRRACKYRAFTPDRLSSLKFALDAESAGSVSRAEQTTSALNSRAHSALGPLARLLLRTESIASSKVEGLQLRARDLARAEARSDTGEKVTPTAKEIIANIDAMELAIEQAASVETFTPAEILAIHERLMKASPTPNVAGMIRTGQNWIGGNDYNPCGADFVPPPSEQVTSLMADLCRAVNDDIFPPVVQAALVHAQFETIHPFADGNGRAGRALIHVVLKRRGLATSYVPPVSVVLARRRKSYIAGLTGFRGDSVVPWIGRFADAVAESANLARTYLDAVVRKVEQWREVLRRHTAVRSDAAAWQVIDALPAHPMITGAAAIAATRRARAAVYQALDQLEQAGILIPVSESQRNKVWEAEGLLALLEGLEAGTPPPPPP